jgi:hypothetical protein
VFIATPGSSVDEFGIALALDKILRDLTPALTLLWAELTARQQRTLLAVALGEHLGAGTAKFHQLAGVHNQGALVSSLRPLVGGPEPIVEKVGTRYRVRQHFVRLWLARSRAYVEQHIPVLREPAAYEAALERVSASLPRLAPPPGG